MTSGTSACTNPSDMYYDVLADRVRFFKESKEGVAIMCRAIEDMWNKAVKEGWQEGKQEGLQEGEQKGRQEGILESNRETARRMLAAGKYEIGRAHV